MVNQPYSASSIANRFQRFSRIEAAGGIVILAALLAAIIIANSPLNQLFKDFLETPLSIGAGRFIFAIGIREWVNQGFLTLFFLITGLELKREILAGEMAGFRKALLPILAATGGIVVPVVLFRVIAPQGTPPGSWFIPATSDIALIMVALSLLGNRIPLELKFFLASIALIDNLAVGSVVSIITIKPVALNYLIIAAGLYLYLIIFYLLKLKLAVIYLLVGSAIWVMFYLTGLQPAFVGILIALTIPIGRKTKIGRFRYKIHENLILFENVHARKTILTDSQMAALDNMRSEVRKVQSPLQLIEHRLHKFVIFFVLPVFALINGGIELSAFANIMQFQGIAYITFISLLVGKIVGVGGISLLLLKTRLCKYPGNLNIRHMACAGLFAPISFTVSFFTADIILNPLFAEEAKAGIMAASLTGAFLGIILLLVLIKPVQKKHENEQFEREIDTSK